MRLLTGWPAIPIEVAPIAAHSVLQALRSLGSSAPLVRQHNLAKAGPVKTDQDFYIIDAPFPPLLIARHTSEAPLDCSRDGNWQVETLAEKIKDIPGVLEVGLFYGTNGYQAHGKGAVAGGQKPVAVYFGMTDGQVEVREAHAGL